jgi:hypothetical protein
MKVKVLSICFWPKLFAKKRTGGLTAEDEAKTIILGAKAAKLYPGELDADDADERERMEDFALAYALNHIKGLGYKIESVIFRIDYIDNGARWQVVISS